MSTFGSEHLGFDAPNQQGAGQVELRGGGSQRNAVAVLSTTWQALCDCIQLEGGSWVMTMLSSQPIT